MFNSLKSYIICSLLMMNTFAIGPINDPFDGLWPAALRKNGTAGAINNNNNNNKAKNDNDWWAEQKPSRIVFVTVKQEKNDVGHASSQLDKAMIVDKCVHGVKCEKMEQISMEEGQQKWAPPTRTSGQCGEGLAKIKCEKREDTSMEEQETEKEHRDRENFGKSLSIGSAAAVSRANDTDNHASADDGDDDEHQPMEHDHLLQNNADYNMDNDGKDDDDDVDVDEDYANISTQLQPKQQRLTSSRGHQKFLTRAEKLEVVNTFMQLKSEGHAAKNKRPYEKINKEIEAKIGVCIRTITAWKRELGIERIVREFSTSEKIEMLNQFDTMRALHPELGSATICKRLKLTKSSVYKWKKQQLPDAAAVVDGDDHHEHDDDDAAAEGAAILAKNFDEDEKFHIFKSYEKLIKENPRLSQHEIATKLDIDQNKLVELRKECQKNYTPNRCLPDKEKCKIIEKFEQMVNKIEHQPITRSDREQIAAQIGISLRTIEKWKNALGFNDSQRAKYMKKMKMIKNYYKIKRKNAKMSANQFAKRYNMSKANLFYWKKQYDEIMQNYGTAAADGAQQLSSSSTDAHPCNLADQKVWEWNKCTRKRCQGHKRKLDQRN